MVASINTILTVDAWLNPEYVQERWSQLPLDTVYPISLAWEGWESEPCFLAAAWPVAWHHPDTLKKVDIITVEEQEYLLHLAKVGRSQQLLRRAWLQAAEEAVNYAKQIADLSCGVDTTWRAMLSDAESALSTRLTVLIVVTTIKRIIRDCGTHPGAKFVSSLSERAITPPTQIRLICEHIPTVEYDERVYPLIVSL